MRAFDKVYIITVILIIILFAGFNIAMADYNISQGSRQYRVEIKRAALEIEEKGYNGIDISKYKYITNIQKYNNNGSFYNVNSDYYICVINGLLYRFDYIADGSGNTGIIIQADIIIIIMAAVVVAVFTFVRQKILLPFEELSELPYELSKGNLVIPLKENKNRYFGKFLWGLDLLRENTMEQKQRELKLQKDKNTLLLSISHDIKTPLSAIKLYSKAFLTNLYKDSAKQREIAEKINKKTDEIEKFVSQIAKASGEEYLSLDVNADEIFLSSVINKIAGYYNEKLGLVNIKFDIGEYTDCLIYGDTSRAAEVVQNIIENAIKYGDGDIISIDITEEDGCILVAVRNSGNNLPETELPHIFDSFWRGSNAESNKGSGLGLYICRQLMHKMNGEIFAEIKGKDMVVTVVFQKI
ncbi:MAG: HAMP domain-containing sensor histidine kinase [Lachnospiraceae bacterium]|nr:HAMP domain-containing sensor histidine kinase [Lachnospiraceae bacterium]